MTMFRRWSQQEIEFLKQNYGIIPTREIASKLGRTLFAVQNKVKKLRKKGELGHYSDKLPTLKCSETDKAYLAGLIDGDGSICLNKEKRRYYRLNVEVSSRNKDHLEYIQRIFGGYIVESMKNGAKLYVWMCRGRQAEAVLRAIAPYLILKKKQAEIALEYRDMFRNKGKNRFNPLTPEEIKRREEIYNSLRKINRKGENTW